MRQLLFHLYTFTLQGIEKVDQGQGNEEDLGHEIEIVKEGTEMIVIATGGYHPITNIFISTYKPGVTFFGHTIFTLFSAPAPISTPQGHFLKYMCTSAP